MKTDKRQTLAREMSRMNAKDRAMTKAIHNWRKKERGGFSLGELECLVMKSLANGMAKEK